MNTTNRTIAVVGVCAMLLLAAGARALEPQMSDAENLVLRLATSDLSSEKHLLPGHAIERFAAWTEHVLKEGAAQRNTWTISTVQKADRFEFITADADGLSIRQLPEVVMLGITPKAPRWRDNLGDTAIQFLKANVQGEWDKTKVSVPKKVGDVVFLESIGAFSEEVGTARNSFVGVVVGDKLWICLPKRLALGGPAVYFFTIDGNKRWFSARPGGR